MKVMPIYGTRPEAIKMAPLVRALVEDPDIACVTVVTGQHRDMLDQVNSVFGLVPDEDLDIFEHGLTPNGIIERTMSRLVPVLEKHQPDAVVVQGDTTSALAAGIAAFNLRIPVVHLEAGLRTSSIASPFPEEGNRRLLSQITSLHLAPTPLSRHNLVASGVDPHAIVVTGNTVIDALHIALASGLEFADPQLRALATSTETVVLVTSHRRESWGEPMRRTAAALAHIAKSRPAITLVFPLHANPLVRDIFVPALSGLDNVILTEPLGYSDLVLMLDRAALVVTDSGGIQEEAPALGKPVVVLREDTERPEAVEAGTAILVGTDAEAIVDAVARLLDDDAEYAMMARAVNPFGDGKATARATAALKEMLGQGSRLPDFDPRSEQRVKETD